MAGTSCPGHHGESVRRVNSFSMANGQMHVCCTSGLGGDFTEEVQHVPQVGLIAQARANGCTSGGTPPFDDPGPAKAVTSGKITG
jgi:hypothetical protein